MLLGKLVDYIKDMKDRIECRHCDFKTHNGLKMLYHIKHKHQHTPTKRDWKFALKYGIVARTIRCLLACVLIPPLFIIKCVCYIFIILDEII